ncbi:MAG: signal peptidase II [Dehalococcoidia bacterium]
MNDAVGAGIQSGLTGRARATATSPKQWWVLGVVAAVVFAADQLTKHLIRVRLDYGEAWPSLSWPVHLEHVSNSGAAFGILQNQTMFLILTSLIGLGAIVLYFVYPPFHHPLLRVAFGMQLGGAVGNLLDRVRMGNVTDFIKFPHYPTFNVADSSIVVGVFILAWFLLFREGQQRQRDEE